MRFGEVFRYELAYRLRSVSTWIYAGFLFLPAAAVAWLLPEPPDEVSV